MTNHLQQVELFVKTMEQGVEENKISPEEAFRQINEVFANVIRSLLPQIEAANHALHHVVSLQNESFAQLCRIDNRLNHDRPKIVCLCGSTKFMKQFIEANREETLNGNIVLSVGCDLKGDDWFSQFSAEKMEQIKKVLDPLHLEKIKLSDEVLVINIGGYIGQSTRNEIKFAESLGKRVRYLEE